VLRCVCDEIVLVFVVVDAGTNGRVTLLRLDYMSCFVCCWLFSSTVSAVNSFHKLSVACFSFYAMSFCFLFCQKLSTNALFYSFLILMFSKLTSSVLVFVKIEQLFTILSLDC